MNPHLSENSLVTIKEKAQGRGIVLSVGINGVEERMLADERFDFPPVFLT